MIGLIMAGGRGTRMGAAGEKLLLRYKRPVILHVADALGGSGCLSDVVAVTGPASPRTRRLLECSGVRTEASAGAGYSADLGAALQGIDDDVLVVPGDLPLLDAGAVRRVCALYDPQRVWTAVLVPRVPGAGCDAPVTHGGARCCRTGISLVDARQICSARPVDESYEVVDDPRLALDLDTREDYDRLLGAARDPAVHPGPGAGGL